MHSTCIQLCNVRLKQLGCELLQLKGSYSCVRCTVLVTYVVNRWCCQGAVTPVPLTFGPWDASLGSCYRGWLAWGRPPPPSCRWPPCLPSRASPKHPRKGTPLGAYAPWLLACLSAAFIQFCLPIGHKNIDACAVIHQLALPKEINPAHAAHAAHEQFEKHM